MFGNPPRINLPANPDMACRSLPLYRNGKPDLCRNRRTNDIAALQNRARRLWSMRKAPARYGAALPWRKGRRGVKRSGRAASRLDSLQILRFFAALLVVIGHTQHALLERLGAAAGRYAFVPLDWGLGVDVFFVISGFVMYYLMHDRFAQAGATATFLRRRVVRVVPMYWLFTTLVRFDPVYHGHFKCNVRRLIDYPRLRALAERIAALPGVADTIDLAQIKAHYYRSHRAINPTGIVPAGPAVAF